LSEPLKRLLNRWMSGNNIVGEINALGSASAYPVFSWYCIMAGMGIFPDAESLRPASGSEKKFRMAEIQNLLSRARPISVITAPCCSIYRRGAQRSRCRSTSGDVRARRSGRVAGSR
jgi:hypothetical protein